MLWTRFKDRYLFDYTPAALRLWLTIAAVGAIGLGSALLGLLHVPLEQNLRLIGWLALVALAASAPVGIHGTKHSVAAGDALIFLLLTLYGPPGAIIGGAIEGFIASKRSSKRLSSWVASSMAMAGAMFIASALYIQLNVLLYSVGLEYPTTLLMALLPTTIVYWIATSLPVVWLLYLKNREPLHLSTWLGYAALPGAAQLLLAMFAGVLAIGGRYFGHLPVIAVVLLTVAALGLLHVHSAKVERDEQNRRRRSTDGDAK